MPKDDKVVCLGTMNPYKELEKLVDVFNTNGIRLEIAGKFLNRQRCIDLQHRAKDNVIVENVVLSEDDYYRKLAGAKYSILPYNMKVYGGRTSGVLLESTYVGTIPIAPKRLLEENEVLGLGYQMLEELSDVNCLQEGVTEKANGYFVKKENVSNDILNFLLDVMQAI